MLFVMYLRDEIIYPVAVLYVIQTSFWESDEAPKLKHRHYQSTVGGVTPVSMPALSQSYA